MKISSKFFILKKKVLNKVETFSANEIFPSIKILSLQGNTYYLEIHVVSHQILFTEIFMFIGFI